MVSHFGDESIAGALYSAVKRLPFEKRKLKTVCPVPPNLNNMESSDLGMV